MNTPIDPVGLEKMHRLHQMAEATQPSTGPALHSYSVDSKDHCMLRWPDGEILEYQRVHDLDTWLNGQPSAKAIRATALLARWFGGDSDATLYSETDAFLPEALGGSAP